MLGNILFALWFFLPAGYGNMTPVFASKIPLLNKLDQPMDFGKSWRGKRIFGDNKTWRGLILGVITATIILWIQQYLYKNTGWAQTLSKDVDYGSLPVFILGPLFGAGALLGDAVESFIKRRLGVDAGKSWFPFDQTDYVFGGLLASSFVATLSLEHYLTIIIVWFCLHIVTNYIGYLIGMRDEKI